MTKIIGRQVSVGIGKEAIRGTAVAPTYWLPFTEATIENRVEPVNDEMSLARLEDADGMSVVSKYGEGTISGKMKDKSIGLILLSLLGTDTPSLVEAGVYDHVYTLDQITGHPSLTVALKDANRDDRYPNAVIDYLKLTAELGNFVMFETGFLSKPSAGAAGNTVSHSADRDYVPKMVTFKHATNLAGLGAASATTIRNLVIEIKQNVVKEDVLGSESPNDILNQQFSIEGTITLVHDGATFQTYQEAETYRAMRFTILHTDTIGAASKPTLTIDLARARIYDYERKLDLNNLVEETFSFKAYYSIADTKMFVITLRNAVATY